MASSGAQGVKIIYESRCLSALSIRPSVTSVKSCQGYSDLQAALSAFSFSLSELSILHRRRDHGV